MTLQRRHTLTAHLLLLAVVFVWGTTFSLVKSALADVSPLLFNLLRMALAFAILAAINHRTLRGLTRRDLRFGAAAGLFLGLGYQFQTAGLDHTTAAKSAFITGLVVVFVPLLSIIPGISGAGASANGPQKPTLDVYAGALLAFAGLVLLTTPPTSLHRESHRALFSGMGLGEALTLLCAIAFAAHLLTLARAASAPREASLLAARRLGTLQIGFAAFAMLLTLPFDGAPHFHSARIVWLALGVTALLATAAAFTIQSWAQQHLPASHTALIFTLEPVFAWLTSLAFFGETLGRRALSGAALILAGILLSELRPTSRRRAALLPGAGA